MQHDAFTADSCEVRCSMVQCGAVCYSALQCAAVCCSVLKCVAVRYSVLQRAVLCCTVLQCAAVCCNMLTDTRSGALKHINIFKSVHILGSRVLQCVAARCSELQCVDRHLRPRMERLHPKRQELIFCQIVSIVIVLNARQIRLDL